ncbi:MAG TPA: phospho-sugar mutase [Euzebyales bacterium]|nr:phospho-sugar mutase [Euzebyales bacterium]
MAPPVGHEASTVEQARAWLEVDPDPETRAELEELIAADGPKLEERFAGRLAFGTAGLRGALGAGPNRMNRVVVRQATAGVAACLAQDADPARTIVVVGRDARHKSDVFARDAVAVLAAAGFDVRWWADPVPTPYLAYVARLLGAGAGIQVTASHNPAADNGYKVYWRGGGQITPDVADRIAAAIDEVATPTDIEDAPAGHALPTDLIDAYRAAALRLLPPGSARDLSIAYTPLHGVAGAPTVALLAHAGFADVAVVDDQFTPDPDFPTVSFPNPEEPGALDVCVALARERNADLVLANDPDGDRVGAAVPDGDGWRLLSGDEIGCLLADYLLEQRPGSDERVVATTVVSSQLLARIAAHHGVGYVETLTGFKWLADAAEREARAGRTLVLGYEEALGVMIGDAVRDKDGMSAALVLADCAAREKARGRQLTDRLDDLARRHGLHAKAQTYVRYEPGDDVPGRVLARLREDPPEVLAGSEVTAVSDFERGQQRAGDGTITAIDLPPTGMIAMTLADGSRMQVRPSGTEPKLKFYVEVVESVGDTVDAARERAAERLEAVVAGLYAATGLDAPAAEVTTTAR